MVLELYFQIKIILLYVDLSAVEPTKMQNREKLCFRKVSILAGKTVFFGT